MPLGLPIEEDDPSKEEVDLKKSTGISLALRDLLSLNYTWPVNKQPPQSITRRDAAMVLESKKVRGHFFSPESIKPTMNPSTRGCARHSIKKKRGRGGEEAAQYYIYFFKKEE